MGFPNDKHRYRPAPPQILATEDRFNTWKADLSNVTGMPVTLADDGDGWPSKGNNRPSYIAAGASSNEAVVPREPPPSFRQRYHRNGDGRVVYPGAIVMDRSRRTPSPPTIASELRKHGAAADAFIASCEWDTSDRSRRRRSSNATITHRHTQENQLMSEHHQHNENSDGLSLLSPPPNPSNGVKNAQRDMAEILGFPVQTFPIPASSRDTANLDEMHSRVPLSRSQEEHHGSGSRGSRHDREIAQDEMDMARPSTRTRASSHSFSTRTRDDASRGLGLGFDPAPATGQIISSSLDLERLNHSLMHISTQERAEQIPEHTRSVASAPTHQSDVHVGSRTGLPLYRSQSYGASGSTIDPLPDIGLFLPSWPSETAVPRSHNDDAEHAMHSQPRQDHRPQAPHTHSEPSHLQRNHEFPAPTAMADFAHDRPKTSHPQPHTFEAANGSNERTAVPVNNVPGRSRRSTREPVLPSFSSVLNSNITAPLPNSQPSMLLTFPPSGPPVPTTAAAPVLQRDGAPSRIHAPYPLHGRQSNFMSWPPSRSSR